MEISRYETAKNIQNRIRLVKKFLDEYSRDGVVLFRLHEKDINVSRILNSVEAPPYDLQTKFISTAIEHYKAELADLEAQFNQL